MCRIVSRHPTVTEPSRLSFSNSRLQRPAVPLSTLRPFSFPRRKRTEATAQRTSTERKQRKNTNCSLFSSVALFLPSMD
ncbi:hypothetical protein BHE74_00044642 [Ensete ventricosum]|nr:hypothetical protein BHE74_00044642 [Ensete ventricosum]RZS04819.1 hypothetical protein BHM03_00035218 [Ensete ventricosum]